MTESTRANLQARWQAIAAELAEIRAGRIVSERQAISVNEVALLEEQDAIVNELAMLDFAERGREKNSGT
jgi:hypothetical protein